MIARAKKARRPISVASDRQFARTHLPLASDIQRLEVSASVRKLLVDRLQAVSRVHEAEAEVAMARSALARVDARLVAAGYLIER